MLERLVEATYTRDRRRHLAAAYLRPENLRFLCRLAKDLQHLDDSAVRRVLLAARATARPSRILRAVASLSMARTASATLALGLRSRARAIAGAGGGE